MLIRVCAAVAAAAGVLFASPAEASRGMASYYSRGQQTASGERFNPNAMTCAHKTLPFQTHVKVTNLRNGRSIVCRISDRGPYIAGRIIDLSTEGARRLSMIGSGVAPVSVEVVQ